MTRFRPFLNTDPPALVDVWRSQPPMRGLMQPMSIQVLEEMVLSKPYFDRLGLIVAELDGKVVGFAHAGFAPNADKSDISTSDGVTCLLLISPSAPASLREELLEKSEAYLRTSGAQKLYAGSYPPWNPFYFGLYGGSNSPGVLKSDQTMTDALLRADYQPVGECLILQRELAGFRPPVDRKQMKVRRQYTVQAMLDCRWDSWWDVCTIGQSNQVRFQLTKRSGQSDNGHVTFWDMEPIASGWGVQAKGILDLRIESSLRGEGLATFLLSESLRQLYAEGTSLVQVQVPQDDAAAIATFVKLGFHEIDRGVVFAKQP